MTNKRLPIARLLLSTALLIYHNSTISTLKLPIEADEQVVQKVVGLVTPAFQNPIHPSDLSSSTNPQYNIKSSGRYFVTGDLSQNSSSVPATGIILLITASNVSLDLNSKTVLPNVISSITTGTGIAVAAGLSNVLLMNGSVSANDNAGNQRLNNGINLSETTVSGGSGTSYSIKLQNIHVRECGINGIYGSSINDLLVANCAVTDGNGNERTAAMTGLNLGNVNNLVIRDCIFDNNAGPVGAYDCNGIFLLDCVDGVLENISASNNTSENGNVAGIQLYGNSTGCHNLKLSLANCSNNQATGTGTGRGLLLNNNEGANLCTLINVYDSSFNSNSSLGGSTRGVDVASGSSNNRFVRCQVNGNYSNAIDAVGLDLSTNSFGNYLEEVTTNNNYTTANAGASGLTISSSNNTLIRCTSSYNRNVNTGAAGSANVYGFSINGNCNLLQDCQAISNSSSAAAAIQVAGFYLYGGNQVNTLKNCVANANNASNTTNNVLTAGFLVASNETFSQFVNCEAASNLIGDGTSSASEAYVYGIYFSGSSSGATECAVKNCYIAQNSVGLSGSGLAFGFYDNSNTFSTLLIGNVAVGQGSCLNDLNSSLQWNDNNQPTASQNYFFKLPGTGDDPRGAIQEVARDDFTSLSTAVRLWQNVSVYDPSGV